MKFIKDRFKLSAALIGVVLIGSGSFGGVVYAGDKDEQTRLVMVDCDKGQDLQEVLWQYLDDKKPLEIIVKGTCGEGPEDEVTVERDKVLFEGDEDVGGFINARFLVEQARNVEIDDNMRLFNLYISSGEVSIEAEGTVTIENEVFLVRKSSLTIETDSDDDDGVLTTGLVEVNGPITIESHSLLSVESQVAEGEESAGDVVLGSLFARLQSSVDLNHTTVGDIIVLEFDSHALLGEGLATNSQFGVTQVSCDKQSRAWSQSPTNPEYPADFYFNPVWGMVEESCKTDPPPPPPGP